MAKTLALPVHRILGDYCATALIEGNCPENHDYTQPVGVPETHHEIVSALRDHLFLLRVGQETPEQFAENITELDKRYIQVGQYTRTHDVPEFGSARIVAVSV